MITFEDLNIGKFYTRWDDAIYKVIDKGDDWYLTLKYSNNHHVFNPIIHSKDELLDVKILKTINGTQLQMIHIG